MVIVKPGPVSKFGSQYQDVVTKLHSTTQARKPVPASVLCQDYARRVGKWNEKTGFGQGKQMSTESLQAMWLLSFRRINSKEGVAGKKSMSFINLICVSLMKIWMNILPDANWLWSGLMWPGGWELSPVSRLGWPGGLLVTLSLLSRLSLVTASLLTSHFGLAMGPSQSG